MAPGTYLTIVFFCLFWSLCGLARPRMLFFARPEWQTRHNAFYFPLSCAAFCFFCFLSSSGAGISWLVTCIVALFPLLYFLVLCGVGLRKNVPVPRTKPGRETPRSSLKQ